MLTRPLFRSLHFCRPWTRTPSRLALASPVRWMSDEENDYNNRTRKLPLLCNFPEIVIPKITHTLRNWFFSTFLIKPYFDHEFSRKEFIEGAKTAIEMVSHSLAYGDFEPLRDIVDPDCLRNIQLKLSLMSLAERKLLATKKEDIYLSFIYQIGIMLEDIEQKTPESPSHTRHVEITMVGYSFPGYDDLLKSGKDYKTLMSELKDDEDGPIVLNYRFIRNFTKGVEDHWQINVINHFYMNEAG